MSDATAYPEAGPGFWELVRAKLAPDNTRPIVSPALVALQQNNPKALRDAYFVDTGEPVGSDLQLLMGPPFEEDPSNASEANDRVLGQLRNLTDEERAQRIERMDEARKRLGLLGVKGTEAQQSETPDEPS